MPQMIEFVEFEVAPEREAAFVAGRARADAALSGFIGFLGSELHALQAGGWLLLVRWTNLDAVQAAQSVTLARPGLAALDDWIGLARTVKRFDTGEQRHVYVRSFDEHE